MAHISPKNLKNMAADANISGVKKSDLYKVDPKLLVEEPGFNLRDYSDPDVISHIEAFAEAYAAGRYVPPLLVRTDDAGQIIIIEGHCRRRGALLAIERGAEISTLPCLPFRGSDFERVGIMLASAEGLSLKPLEIAQGFLRLNRMGFPPAEIAAKVGKSVSHIEQMLLLANANHDVHQLVKNGTVSATLAIETVRQMGENAGPYLQKKAEQAKAMGKTNITNKHVRAWSPPKKMVTGMLNSVKKLLDGMDEATRQQVTELQTMPAEMLADKKITISAADYLALIQANDAIESKRPIPSEPEELEEDPEKKPQ